MVTESLGWLVVGRRIEFVYVFTYNYTILSEISIDSSDF